LTAAETLAIRETGYVVAERRGGRVRCVRYRLRFRMAGRLKSRYLGAVAGRANVDALLEQRQQDRALDALVKLAQQFRRSIKPMLQPLIEKTNYHFHGRTLRRSRSKINP
jgi:hypothetical protein